MSGISRYPSSDVPWSACRHGLHFAALPTASSLNVNVLVVEDDSDARAGMARVLLAAGCVITEAEDGRAALQAVESRRFDAIICDLRLPYLPGGAFYEELLKRDPALARRVIFVSAIAHDPAVRRFLDGTGQPYLQKPYDVKELVETVRKMVA